MASPGSVNVWIGEPARAQFEQYVNESRQRLFRFAVVLCGDTVLAGDLIADVLGRAFERWDQVGAARDVHAYVRRMVVNEFVSWQRRRARVVLYAELGHVVDSQASRSGSFGPDIDDVQAERETLLEELSRLPARQRAAIVLRYYEDLSDDDIAATLGCRVGTVRSAISRGLATLRINRAESEGGASS
jgi:RNA polymerase sigma-70 factor (sigma-E family)